ncbi:DDT domain-containing protein PTM isoform X2 [Abrus precatorius]|uniref:DDT domain-containing protein PTM isoform X2 n=1 Tax=Abrus precatorius TaxID=3816 RepID=A0A8B8LXA9_ABRPR|nr:DDT domain-containing protein PTM isoform X2 [Abrus precatorius]
MEFVGKSVKKEVKGVGVISGTVKSYDPSSGFFEILYQDGVSEELEASDVASLIQFQPHLAKAKPRVGRKPKKRRRLERKREIEAASGNVSENLVAEGSEFRGVLDANASAAGGNLELGCGFERGLDVGIENGGNLRGIVNGTVIENGGGETLGKKIGFEENLKKGVSANGNCVKDELDLNSRLNLNEDFNLNDACGSPLNTEDSLKRRDCIDLNLDVSNEDDVSLNASYLGCSGGETLQRECKFDLNVEVCEEVKEAQGDAGANGHYEVNALFSKTGQLPEEDANVNHRPIEDDSVHCSLNHVSDAIKVEVIHISAEHASNDTSLCLIEGKEGEHVKEDAPAIDSLQVSNVISVRDCDSVMVQRMDCHSEGGFVITHECQDDPGSPCKQGNSRRKRRKVSDNLKSTPETVLRRSSRRASARKQDSSTVPVQVTDDPLFSLGTVTLTEENPLIPGSEKYEHCNDPLPKLQLPPSSKNLILDDVPVLELFSIYSCLRSFSTLLFLSPFELEDLVAALKSEIPTILFDSIHDSILQTLRKHLEYLSSEGCQSASNCLRNLNWDFLDLVTWPIFMAEYLLIHGSGFNTGFDLKHLMFRTDYYKQPVIVKVEILQYLCDHMIEVEAIRSELNKRSLVTETDMGFDQNMYFDNCKKRKAVMDVSGGSCLTEENVDDTTDWNSDECCLCKMDGNLICCDGCPAAFHSRCVGIASDNLPEGDWYCPECAIGTHKAWMNSRKSLRGADLVGIDPDGRLYFNSCGYLLVSNTSEAGLLFNYYHRNDLHVVVEALKSMDPLYESILMGIYKHWDIPANFSVATSVFNQSSIENMHMKGEYSTMHTSVAPLTSSETCLDKNQADDQRKLDENSTIDCSMHLGQEFPKAGNRFDSMTTIESPCIASEGSADTTQMRSGVENVQVYGPKNSNRSDESLNQSGVSEKQHLVGECFLTSSSIDVKHKINLRSVGASAAPSTDNKDTSEAPCEIDYINYYSFARTASFVAQVFMCKSPEKMNKNIALSEEEIISDQSKAIMKKSSNFYWPSIQNLSAAAQKEKCGWCYSCKVANEDRDCLFNSVVKPVWEVPKSTLIGLQPRKIQNGHLREIICHIFSLEVRLRGLLLGPWLNLHQTNLWQKDLLKTSDFLPVKRLLLLLESNLRPLALSSDWLKHVDSVATMGSATHVVVNSRTSSRHGIGRKRARYSDIETSSSSNTASGLGMYWWRGGRLSRKLFNWKVLPRSLVTKAARQGGCTKIPGILYLENSDFARRSRYVAWRAAVEMSTSVEQLALQVRELYSNIRWHDIENNHPLYVLDKESRKSVRLFKKAIVRRKCTEGQSVKFLLDFGKRRAIPDIVTKHGSLLEQSSSERKKYWLEESYVPLHLLKNFEEKRIVRRSNDKKLGKILEIGRVNKKVPQQRGFLYLFSRMERSDCHQCEHCNKDVPVRDAVSCLHCKGYFHKRHVRKSGGTRSTKSAYTCHRCQDGLRAKTNTNKRKVESKLQNIQAKKRKHVSSVCKSMNLTGNKKALSKLRQLRSRNNKISSSVPLRRSTRKAKSLYMHSQMNGGHKKGMQGKKNVGRKKGKQNKSKKVASQKSKETTGQYKNLPVTTAHKKRTKPCNSYWLNGLQLSRKPDDDRVMLFKEKKLVFSSEDLSESLDYPKCSLCCGNGGTSMYVACEICGDWFHGDAFGLNRENTIQLIGFRCHVCRDKPAPVCPHMKINTLSHTEGDAAIECGEELANPVSPHPLSEQV